MKPVLFFLLRFVLSYGILSVAYGLFIAHYDAAQPPVTDPITSEVTEQTASFTRAFGYEAGIIKNNHLDFVAIPEQTFDTLVLNGVAAIGIEEGCNGVSVAIVFAAFIFGFGGRWKSMVWYLPAGWLILHAVNILRLFILTLMAVGSNEKMFYYFHKYGITAIIYAVVFALWIIWVKKYGRVHKKEKHAAVGK